ncbi:MAG: class I SAM-dependent methyltransferase [Acidobacteria bacterium]|nr:class I SAM-dependent methyltransferase [Acidobacteriota bacterium]
MQWGEFTAELLAVVAPRVLHLVDPWWRLNPEAEWDWEEPERADARRGHDTVAERFAGPIAEGIVEIHVGFAQEILPSFPDGHFDWLYLDTTHSYEDTREELAVMVPKLKPGGILLGHDWQEDPQHPFHGVCRAVTELVAEGGFRLVALDDHSQWAIERRAMAPAGGAQSPEAFGLRAPSNR